MSFAVRRFTAGVAGALALLALAVPSAQAQFTEPDVSKARVRIGPVLLNPIVELKNFGVDTNVFDEPTGQEKRDVTFTLSPQTDVWLRMGRTWMTANIHEDILWYQTYTSERAGNTGYNLAWLVPLNHVAFQVSTQFLDARDRPGFEIDARSQHTDATFKGAAELRMFARTYVGVRGSQQRVDFDSGATFLGANLRNELNRTITEGAATLRHQLTPLTSISVDVGRIQDRFAYSPLRDANSTTLGVEVQLDPAALIKGSARLGFRDFQPEVASLPGYRGTTAAVDLTYVLLGVTRFSFKASRDISYSFDITQPYYLQTGFEATLAQQIFGPVDVVARGGIQNLAYRDREGVPIIHAQRVDMVHSYGGGLGYHLGDTIRLGVNVDRQQRHSDVTGREYDGLKLGVSITYGF